MGIAVIGAMPEEVGLLKAGMDVRESVTIARMDYVEGALCGQDVVLVACGIGKVNAAACAQALVDRFGVAGIIFTGVAGSLDASIGIGDIVVSTDCVQHDYDVAGLGYAPGVIPDQEVSFFEADPALRAVVVRAVREVAPEMGVHEGRVASGDQFVSDASTKERISSTFGALCAEMEGAAVAHVAWLNDVPFVVVRAISDKADGSAEMDYPTFKAQAAKRSAAIVERALALLQADAPCPRGAPLPHRPWGIKGEAHPHTEVDDDSDQDHHLPL